jgi:hypothetical protein
VVWQSRLALLQIDGSAEYPESYNVLDIDNALEINGEVDDEATNERSQQYSE